MKGFVGKEGKVIIDASMRVTDPDGAVFLEDADLLRKYEAVRIPLGSIETLTLGLTIGKPMEAGKTHLWLCRWWDKKGKAEIPVEVRIKAVTPPK